MFILICDKGKAVPDNTGHESALSPLALPSTKEMLRRLREQQEPPTNARNINTGY